MKDKMQKLKERLADSRGGKVVFVSHCVLNENVRYLGGAFTGGMIAPVVEELGKGEYGIVQMPCPEQLAWGGALKRYMWLGLGTGGSLLYRFRFLLLPMFLLYTRLRFRGLARSTARLARDFTRSGITVSGIVGIDGSPSCGAARRLNMKKCFSILAALSPDTVSRQELNRRLYCECLEPGKGIFLEELVRALERGKLRVPVAAHDLVKESRGERCAIPLDFPS